MNVCLYNLYHSGDMFFYAKIMKEIVKANPTYDFFIVVSCCSMLFDDVRDLKNLKIMYSPHLWKFDQFIKNTAEVNEDNVFRDFLHYSNPYYFLNKTLFINIWKLFIYDIDQLGVTPISNSMTNDITNKLFKELNEKYQTDFFCDFKITDYTPEIPTLDLSFISNIFENHHYDKIIFYYNFYGRSSQENPIIDNECVIKHLLNNNQNSLLIVPSETKVKSPHLISLETHFNIKKDIHGKSLILYANICNLCDDVYLKSNGGSMHVANKTNISNLKTKYYMVTENGEDKFQENLKLEYHLNITCMNISNFF